jgi:endonuclease/exonuclease/phosphatase (EEP) superfamily protein YafD
VTALEAPDATRLAVATWNLERGGVSGRSAVSVLAERPASVVALQELTPAVAEAIEADARVRDVYPHRILRPDPGYVGMALLSTVPLDEVDESRDPAAVWARVRLPDGPAVRLVNAHPFPASIRGIGPVPVGYDPQRRDRSITLVRAIADDLIARGEHVLVLGDFNVTEREPAYEELTAGLHDAHLEVGQGPGFSWRPAPLKGLPLGVVRIDYLLGSRRVRPQSISTDCTPRGSDHCLVRGVFELPPA